MRRDGRQISLRGRRGFTLIEMMVVTAIIGALIAMFFMGYKYWSAGAKASQTQVALQALRAMLQEYENKGGDMTKIDAIFTQNPVPAPGPVADGGSDRTGLAVTNTRRLMKLLLKVPDNKKIYDGLPRGQKGKTGTQEDGMVWETTDGPVLLDAYYNPIIYVPGGGMTGVGLGKTANGPPPTFKSANQTIQAPGGTTTSGRAFFASAGEDGNFLAGDDNKYSFEK